MEPATVARGIHVRDEAAPRRHLRREVVDGVPRRDLGVCDGLPADAQQQEREQEQTSDVAADDARLRDAIPPFGDGVAERAQ